MIVESPNSQASLGARTAGMRLFGAVLLGVFLGSPALADNPRRGRCCGPSPARPVAHDHARLHGWRGDTIRVRVYEEDRLNGVYAVAQDGRVDLPWIGKVSVTGLGPEQIAELVESRYADGYLVSPQVVVDVEAYGSKPVQLLGNIKNPGTYYLEGSTDLIQSSPRPGVSPKTTSCPPTRSTSSGPAPMPWRRSPSPDSGAPGEDGLKVVRRWLSAWSSGVRLGEVVRPGAVAWKEGLTLSRCWPLRVVRHAANLRNVLLIQGDQRIKASIRDIQRGRADDIVIRADDQVIIDESAFWS